MNIFEVLSQGKGSINEENISSFLAYLLDPNEDHGLYTEFLERFLAQLGLKSSEIDSDNFDITLEFPVKTDKKYYIDLIFETNNYIIAIENKILESSKRKNQLQNEYDGLKESEFYKEIGRKPIIMVSLSPKNTDEDIRQEENDCLKELAWQEVLDILIKILEDENKCKINPINEYTKHTIKAFINFMNCLDCKVKEFSLHGRDDYRIIKYSSGKILVEQRVEQENGGDDEPKWEPAQPCSKAIIKAKLRELDSKSYTAEILKKGTTRSLGAKLFKSLN